MKWDSLTLSLLLACTHTHSLSLFLALTPTLLLLLPSFISSFSLSLQFSIFAARLVV